MNSEGDKDTTALIPAGSAEMVIQMEKEGREYDLLVDIVPSERKEELNETLIKARKKFPFLGLGKSRNDTLAQLIAYKGVFESFTPESHPKPVVIVLREESTAAWVLKYQNYVVYEQDKGLVHKVIKTAQVPMEGTPYLTLAISTLFFDEHGIPEMESVTEKIYPETSRK